MNSKELEEDIQMRLKLIKAALEKLDHIGGKSIREFQIMRL